MVLKWFIYLPGFVQPNISGGPPDGVVRPVNGNIYKKNIKLKNKLKLDILITVCHMVSRMRVRPRRRNRSALSKTMTVTVKIMRMMTDGWQRRLRMWKVMMEKAQVICKPFN